MQCPVSSLFFSECKLEPETEQIANDDQNTVSTNGFDSATFTVPVYASPTKSKAQSPNKRVPLFQRTMADAPENSPSSSTKHKKIKKIGAPTTSEDADQINTTEKHTPSTVTASKIKSKSKKEQADSKSIGKKEKPAVLLQKAPPKPFIASCSKEAKTKKAIQIDPLPLLKRNKVESAFKIPKKKSDSNTEVKYSSMVGKNSLPSQVSKEQFKSAFATLSKRSALSPKPIASIINVKEILGLSPAPVKNHATRSECGKANIEAARKILHSTLHHKKPGEIKAMKRRSNLKFNEFDFPKKQPPPPHAVASKSILKRPGETAYVYIRVDSMCIVCDERKFQEKGSSTQHSRRAQ